MSTRTIVDLNIDTWNEGMGDVESVSEALRQVMERIEYGKMEGCIWDVNGNSVGNFRVEFVKEDDEEDTI